VYPAMLSSMRRGQRACLPRCEGASLVFVSYKLGDRLCYHPRYKLYEPLGMASMPECIVLPALALMPSGHRLGYGEGFYDRTLEGLNHIIRIGVTHQPKEALAWQPETHDIILDHCLWF
jgi:5-formyltetrahydrofolate cyclo-ligase